MLTLEKWLAAGVFLCVSAIHFPAPLLSPKGHGPPGTKVGSDLCLQTRLHRLQNHSFLAFVVCLLVGEAGFWPSGG